VVQPSPALLQAKDDVSRLIAHWDDALATRVAADNLFLDRSREQWAAAIRAENEKHGACQPEQSIDAENALRGSWRMQCERGSIKVRLTLAPTMPPKVQLLSVTSVMPPAEETRKQVESQFPAAWGRCTIGEAISESEVRVNCEKGPLTARMADGKVSFAPLRDAEHPCAP
jgi:hypothetical protein